MHGESEGQVAGGERGLGGGGQPAFSAECMSEEQGIARATTWVVQVTWAAPQPPIGRLSG